MTNFKARQLNLRQLHCERIMLDICQINGLCLNREMVGTVQLFSREKVEIGTCVMLRSQENEVVIIRKQDKNQGNH